MGKSVFRELNELIDSLDETYRSINHEISSILGMETTLFKADKKMFCRKFVNGEEVKNVNS